MVAEVEAVVVGVVGVGVAVVGAAAKFSAKV